MILEDAGPFVLIALPVIVTPDSVPIECCRWKREGKYEFNEEEAKKVRSRQMKAKPRPRTTLNE